MLNLRPKTLNLYINKSYECTERMNNKYYHELSHFIQNITKYIITVIF